ncbi:MAG: cytochrome-c oxidase, cbb3-type subunit III [Beijerinckiaceae bacterium]|jgi:cytochrome c oxidase cbb3-type subunit 3
MSTAHHKDVDALSGTSTTGHEWDGIRELNTPLPKWWLYMFYATIVWSIGYFVVYPAIPLATGFTPGVWNWTSRGAVTQELAELAAQRAPMTSALEKASVQEIAGADTLRAFALARGRAAFGDNCAPCHGAGGGGAVSYPNLNDDDWLWGGTLEAIQQTIAFGVRSGHENARAGVMPAFSGALSAREIDQAAEHVRALAGLPTSAGYDKAAGGKIFAEQCAACHGEQGMGNQEFGAPNLTDRIWLFGSDKATIVQTIARGRNSVMPAWTGRLDDTTIKALTVFVHGLGGGK